MRTSLRTITDYPLKGGAIKLAFYSPTLAEKNEARAIDRKLAELRPNEETPKDSDWAAKVEAVSAEADELMLRLLAYVEIRGEEVQADETLRNEVREAAYLDGGLGLQLMQEVCFQAWYEPAGEGT